MHDDDASAYASARAKNQREAVKNTRTLMLINNRLLEYLALIAGRANEEAEETESRTQNVFQRNLGKRIWTEG